MDHTRRAGQTREPDSRWTTEGKPGVSRRPGGPWPQVFFCRIHVLQHDGQVLLDRALGCDPPTHDRCSSSPFATRLRRHLRARLRGRGDDPHGCDRKHARTSGISANRTKHISRTRRAGSHAGRGPTSLQRDRLARHTSSIRARATRTERRHDVARTDWTSAERHIGAAELYRPAG